MAPLTVRVQQVTGPFCAELPYNCHGPCATLTRNADVVLNTGARLEVSRRRLKELLDRLAGQQ